MIPQFLADKLAAILSFRDFCLGGEVASFPLETFLEVSNVCDLKCTMCADFSGESHQRAQTIQAKRRGLIDADAIIERLDPVLRHTLSVHCFGGGEPTIHPDFRRIVGHLAHYDVLIDFFTHGQHLDQAMVEFLMDSGIHKVTVSLSGLTRAVYDRYYLGGDFDRVITGLRRIADCKAAAGSPYPIVEINSLGFRPHVAEFDAFVARMAELGANAIHLKQVQRWPHLPHLHQHVSIFRPWVEGEILARAAAIGQRVGVTVDASQYMAMGAADEQDYRLRLAEMDRELASVAPATAPPARSVAMIRSLDLSESRETVQSLFRTAAPPFAAPFHCMEPFKTLFVTRNGLVRPCCFHNHWSWHLGDITAANAMEIWNGVGYGVARDAIIDGKYPLELCGPCLDKRLGPRNHGAHDQIRAYLAWHRARFGPVLGEELARRAPNVLNDIATAKAERIVARQRREPEQGDPAGLLARLPVSPLLDHTVSAAVEGYLEHVGEEVVGWAWSPLLPGRRLPVSVWQGRRRIAHATADIMRQDLRDAGKGDGAHGFHMLLPIGLPDLTVTIGDDPGRLRFPGPP